MIQWPCIFKLDGDDELLYLASEASLIAEFESLIWSDDDYLIDSQGQGYKVREVQAGAYLSMSLAVTRFLSHKLPILFKHTSFQKRKSA